MPEGLFVKVVDDTTIEYDGKTHGFTKVFNQNATQDEVYTTAAKGMVSHLFAKTDSLIFSYGVTGSGKTYTMMGKSASEDRKKSIAVSGSLDTGSEYRGIIPRLLEDVFQELNNHKEQDYIVIANFIELYENRVNDLLSDFDKHRRDSAMTSYSFSSTMSSRSNISNKSVEVREVNKKFVAQNSQNVTINNPEEGKSLLFFGNSKRAKRATNMNADSSRSHAIFSLTLAKRSPNGLEEPMEVSKITIVDLGGSERQKNTKAEGHSLKEASSINSSLTVLATCMSILKENQERNRNDHIPVRDTILTKMVFSNEFLAGRGKISVIINISPVASQKSETTQTLKFSANVQNIRIAPEENNASRLLSPTRQYRLDSQGSDDTDYRLMYEQQQIIIDRLKEALQMEKEERQRDEMLFREQILTETEVPTRDYNEALQNQAACEIEQLNKKIKYLQKLHRKSNEKLLATAKSEKFYKTQYENEISQRGAEDQHLNLLLTRSQMEIKDLKNDLEEAKLLQNKYLMELSELEEKSCAQLKALEDRFNNQLSEKSQEFECTKKGLADKYKQECDILTRQFESEKEILTKKIQEAENSRKEMKKTAKTFKKKLEEFVEAHRQEEKNNTFLSPIKNKFKSIFSSKSKHEESLAEVIDLDAEEEEEEVTTNKKRKHVLEEDEGTESPSKKNKIEEEEEEEVVKKTKKAPKTKRKTTRKK